VTMSSPEFAVHSGPMPRNAPSPISVVVGHKSALVTAGIAATLARMPECDIRLSQIPEFECDSECNHDDAQLVFGDSILLKHLRGKSSERRKPCSLASAKFVWVTTGDESSAHAAKAAGEIDEHLPLDCPEEELFKVVQRLVGRGASGAWHTPSPRTVPVRLKAVGGLAPRALRRVREYIDHHLSDNFQTDLLARIAGLSPGYFNRAFRQSTGSSPHHYVLQQRVARATELLRETDRALADIALEVGFADQSHFSRTYVAITGETASGYRRRHR